MWTTTSNGVQSAFNPKNGNLFVSSFYTDKIEEFYFQSTPPSVNKVNEYSLPAVSHPYAIVVARSGLVYAGLSAPSFLVRFDPTTGGYTPELMQDYYQSGTGLTYPQAIIQSRFDNSFLFSFGAYTDTSYAVTGAGSIARRDCNDSPCAPPITLTSNLDDEPYTPFQQENGDIFVGTFNGKINKVTPGW